MSGSYRFKRSPFISLIKSTVSQCRSCSSSPGFLADNPAVAFTAIVSPPSVTLLGAGETIIFDLVITNVGNAYKNTTGMFRAPLQGVYVFNFALMMDPGLDEYIELVKDGNHIMWNYGHAPGSTHYISASRTATLELQASNQMYLKQI